MKIKSVSARRGSTYQCLIIQKNVYVSLNYFLFYLYACHRATLYLIAYHARLSVIIAIDYRIHVSRRKSVNKAMRINLDKRPWPQNSHSPRHMRAHMAKQSSWHDNVVNSILYQFILSARYYSLEFIKGYLVLFVEYICLSDTLKPWRFSFDSHW